MDKSLFHVTEYIVPVWTSQKKVSFNKSENQNYGINRFIVRFLMNYIILFARILKISNSEFKQSFERKKPQN